MCTWKRLYHFQLIRNAELSLHTCTAAEQRILCFKCFVTTRDFSLKERLTQQHMLSQEIWLEFEHVNFSCPDTPLPVHLRKEMGARRTNEVILLHPNKNPL